MLHYLQGWSIWRYISGAKLALMKSRAQGRVMAVARVGWNNREAELRLLLQSKLSMGLFCSKMTSEKHIWSVIISFQSTTHPCWEQCKVVGVLFQKYTWLCHSRPFVTRGLVTSLTVFFYCGRCYFVGIHCKTSYLKKCESTGNIEILSSINYLVALSHVKCFPSIRYIRVYLQSWPLRQTLYKDNMSGPVTFNSELRGVWGY